jgi:hypothetical protein
MQIVIEIPEFEIPKRQDIIEIPLHFIDGDVCEAGGYGFDVLPKGHGRLKDVDHYIKMEWEHPDYSLTDDEPTIIEADIDSEVREC